MTLPVARSRWGMAPGRTFWLQLSSLTGFLFLLPGVLPQSACAQGTTEPMVMRTGAGTVLQTRTTLLSPVGSNLMLWFGYATGETPTPGVFADSFTISVQSDAGIVYLLTADVNGVSWAPPTPGAVPISEASIVRTNTSFAVSNEGLTPLAAYYVNYTLPASWNTLPLTLNFDLFDNQDLHASLAYFQTIPEPESQALLALALGLSTFFWLRRRV